jgi:hypothetical protein
MAQEMITQLPTVDAATLADIIYAVQGGVSVQETLAQVQALGLANTILSFAGNPNGNVAGTTFQLCWDTVDDILYICTTTGTATTAVWTSAGSHPIPLPLNQGGTNAELTANDGGIVYSTASAMAILPGTPDAGQLLQSGVSSAPSWTTATYPATVGLNQILYGEAANNIEGLPTATNGVLITDGTTGIPSISSTLPTAVQDNITQTGTVVAGNWEGSIVAPAFGGTGINNGSSTITVGGTTALLGAHTFAGTLTGNTAVTFPVSGTLATTSQLPTGAALTETNDTNVTLTLGGTPSTALLQATSITAGWTGTLSPTRGGTGANLSTTGGTSQVLQQTTVGGNVTVGQLAASNLSNGTTGSGAVALATSPTFVTPILGTPTSATLTNATGLPLTTGVTGNLPVTNLNSGTAASGTTFWRGDGTWATPSGGGGSGTVNSGTVGQIAFYAATGTAVSGETFVPLSAGGTNAALTASNGGIPYSTASAISLLSGTATAGLALLSGASGAPAWSTSKPITKVNVQTFTSSGTYTPSSGMVFAWVKAVGGGAGGGTAQVSGTAALAGGGGGAGSYGEGLYTAATIGATQTVTVGANGLPNASGTGSSLGTLLVTNGGNTGGNAANNTVNAGGPGGNAGSGGFINLPGIDGMAGFAAAAATSALGQVVIVGGQGANSPVGVGGLSPILTITGSTAGSLGSGFGAGGSGAVYNGTTGSAPGGGGSPGIVIITEFISI